MINKWYGTSVLVLITAMPAVAHKAPKSVEPLLTPSVVIQADEHLGAIRSEFQIISHKTPAWRAEVRKQGFDLAFTEWLVYAHPWEFAVVCSKAADDMMKDAAQRSLVAQFDEAVQQDLMLQNEIKTASEPAAFLDWLRANHPEEYKRALAKVGVTDSTSPHGIYGWGPVDSVADNTHE